MLEGMNSGLYTVHKYYGEFLQVVPLVVLVWYALRGKTPLQHVAPVLLDISVALGLILYLLGGKQVSIWHPAWTGVLVLLVVGIQIARGQIMV